MKHSERGDDRLAQSLRMLGEIEAVSMTPPRVEHAVMARWDAEHDPRRRADVRTRRIVRATTAVAAGITLAAALVWQRGASELLVRLKPDTTHATPDTVVSGFSRTNNSQFTTVAVVGGPLTADEPIRVVRMRVARSVLGELGIPSPAQRGAASVETVDIDVLVGEDGVARGVRVPISEL